MAAGVLVKVRVIYRLLKNAEASVRMEGYRVTPQMREQCARVLHGETTTAELLKRFSKSAGRT